MKLLPFSLGAFCRQPFAFFLAGISRALAFFVPARSRLQNSTYLIADIISPALHDKRNFPRRTVIQQSYIIPILLSKQSPLDKFQWHLNGLHAKIIL